MELAPAPEFRLAGPEEQGRIAAGGSALVDYVLNPPGAPPRERGGQGLRRGADRRTTALEALTASAFDP